MINEKLYNLPKNWILTSIGEISIISSGGTPDRKNYSFFKGDIPWVKSGELNYNTIINTEEHINTFALNQSNAKVSPKNYYLYRHSISIDFFNIFFIF